MKNKKILTFFTFILLILIGSYLIIKDNYYIINYIIIIIGIVGSLIAIIEYIFPEKKIISKLGIRNYSHKQSKFVNRIEEVNEIFSLLSLKKEIMNVYGDKGVGKSEILRMVSDLTNWKIGNKTHKRYQKSNLLDTRKNYKVIYYDLSDKTGIDDIKKEISLKSYPDMRASYELFLKQLESDYSKKSLIIIFDNLNNPALYQEISRLIRFHWSIRSKDIFIIGSIEQFNIFDLPISYIEILPLEEKEVLEYAIIKGKELGPDEINNVLSISNGLPIFLEIVFSSNINLLESTSINSSINAIIIDQLIPNLSDEELELLKYASFMSLVSSEIRIKELEKLKLTNIRNNINKLKFNSLVIINRKNDLRSFKVHDRVRDIILASYLKNSLDINSAIGDYYKNEEKNREACIHYLLSNSCKKNSQYIIDTINLEIKKENLPFLFTIGQLYKQYGFTIKNETNSKTLIKTILHAHLYSTLGIGNYNESRRIVEAIVLGSYNIPRIDSVDSNLDFELHYLIADLDHLQNNYSLSIESFQRLLTCARKNKFSDKITKCLWGIGHCYRHQGKELEKAMLYYKKCERKAKTIGDKRYLCKALNEQLSIHLIWNDFDYDYSKVFTEIYKILATDDKAFTVRMSTMKYHSIYLRLIQDYINSELYINQAYEGLKKIGKRTSYNLQFEFAEYYRELKDYQNAIINYKNVLDFSLKNNDRNLKSNALLGLIITEISSKKYYYHSNDDEIIQELIDIIKLTTEADIHITNVQAKIILELIKVNKDISFNGYEPNFGAYLQRLKLEREYLCYDEMSLSHINNLKLILL